MDTKKDKDPFLKDKPYFLSWFVSFSVLVVTYSILSMTKIISGNAFSEINILALLGTTGLACFFMSITDKLNLKNSIFIALIDIADIIVSVFSINFIAAVFIDKTGLFFDVDEIVLVLVMIVFIYSVVCLIFFINNLKSERDINNKIKEMKQGGKQVEQDNRGE